MADFTVTPVQPADKPEWRALFDGYATFYETPMDDATADRVWAWLLDPDHVLEGILVRDTSGKAVGFAHIRACPRTLGGSEIGFLDDLFVAPDSRGSGAADALFGYMRSMAQQRGWSTIRWITQHFNARGRAFYDRYTNGPSDFIVYQWHPDAV